MGIFLKLIDTPLVAVEEAAIDGNDFSAELFPEEAKSITKAVKKRRIEFSLGRFLARQALDSLGIAPVAVPANSDRSPSWPHNVVGSITHCNSLCAAAVGVRKDVQLLGIDIEEYLLRKLDDNMIAHICVPEELQWLSGFSTDARKRAAMAIFSAKEAWYKACYIETRKILDFQSARIEFRHFGSSGAIWTGVLLSDWGPYRKGEQFSFGRSAFDDRYVASVFIKMN